LGVQARLVHHGIDSALFLLGRLTNIYADKAAEEHKDQANKKVVVSVVFQPGNAMGEAEKKPIVIKSYTFTPVN
jgi:hypothetical protein